MDTNILSTAFRELVEAAETLENEPLKRWKQEGGKVMGYFCSSMSEEVLLAAGFLPFRMRATGSTDTELSDALVSSINCSFMRHCLDAGLSGSLDFLDGLIVPNSCDNIRRIYDHWIRKKDTPFVRMVSLPRKAEESQIAWYREEMVNLKTAMEDHLDIKVSDNDLREAIKLRNETRRLQRALYDLRKTENPPITGSETLTVIVAGTGMPREHYNDLLKQLLADLQGAQGTGNYQARLMIIGGELDNPEYLKVIEDQGGLVVTDSLCFGTRMLIKDVDENEKDPLTAIARYYVAERPTCPRVFGMYEKRSELIKQMIEDFNVDGVIFQRLSFCDLWGIEQFTIKNEFEDWNIPLMMLDREYTLSGVGQLRTRVQAFLETIGR
jgi:benzoyl-CoA reductase subunit C